MTRMSSPAGDSRSGTVRLEREGNLAIIVNDNPDKHNAFDDEMDLQLFQILDELARDTTVRCILWRGEGRSFSSGRDVSSIGGGAVTLSHHELMKRGHRGIAPLLSMDVPVVVAMQGWAAGASFQRALLADMRIASTDAKFRLPEATFGVIPDTGGVARLFQMCGHGVASDLVLTGRILPAEEAFTHGVVSRLVEPAALEAIAREVCEKIASLPMATVAMAKRVIRHLAEPAVRSSMAEELIGQTYLSRSHDLTEFRAARAEDRQPTYTGS